MEEKKLNPLAGVYNCTRFRRLLKNLFPYGQKSSPCKRAGKIVAIGKESHEKRTRALFQVSGGRSDSFFERQDFRWLQC